MEKELGPFGISVFKVQVNHDLDAYSFRRPKPYYAARRFTDDKYAFVCDDFSDMGHLLISCYKPGARITTPEESRTIDDVTLNHGSLKVTEEPLTRDELFDLLSRVAECGKKYWKVAYEQQEQNT